MRFRLRFGELAGDVERLCRDKRASPANLGIQVGNEHGVNLQRCR
jgi:hypothetical protein